MMETKCSTYKSQWYPTSPSYPLLLHPTFRSNQSPGLLTLARTPYSDLLGVVYLIVAFESVAIDIHCCLDSLASSVCCSDCRWAASALSRCVRTGLRTTTLQVCDDLSSWPLAVA